MVFGCVVAFHRRGWPSTDIVAVEGHFSDLKANRQICCVGVWVPVCWSVCGGMCWCVLVCVGVCERVVCVIVVVVCVMLCVCICCCWWCACV